MNYLIIGNGIAGTTAAEQIRGRDADGRIIILSREKTPFYHRIRLIDYLAGELPEEKLIIRRPEWYEQRRLELKLGREVNEADPAAGTVTTTGGESYSYDRLLLAIGSHPFIPPISGSRRQGVFSFHTLRDARAIREAAGDGKKAVVIGGGLLGLETANSLRKRGLSVCVVEFLPRLLPLQLDDSGAARLRKLMEDMGLSFRLGCRTRELTGRGDTVKGVQLDNGEEIPADLVVIAAGVRPNLELARRLEVECDRGILVDHRLATSKPDVYAAGDVIEWQGRPYGIWPAAREQGEIAGINMAGGEEEYRGTTMANVLKVAGIKLAAAGDIDAEGRLECLASGGRDFYHKLVLEEGRAAGCIMVGDISDFHRLTRAIGNRVPLAELEPELVDRFRSPGD